MNYLGDITANPNDFIPKWKERLSSKPEADALKTAVTVCEMYIADIRTPPTSGIDTAFLQKFVLVIAQCMAIRAAFDQTFGPFVQKTEKYPDLTKRFNQVFIDLAAIQESLKGIDPTIADKYVDFLKARDSAISKGDLDSPLVHKDLKAEIIHRSLTAPQTMQKSVVDAVQSKYSGSYPKSPKTTFPIAKVAAVAIGAFVAYKALS